ncbi:deoxyribonuclease V [Gloeocapsa sp. PCC 73106]|uniref:deoxyribonuclease V n=1 Tax=Gloeocapsa sp. PCC 73106 TaxID=102232 RepID=UPI0002AC041D|nr:deoxyribonuclease V [Gloeocapsa sp. PCC 73106]ELR97031.1 deoxyinosine 3'endonuclease (endonuclease V) [Gloeocapsa sp. PCC 73106]
MIIPPTLAAAKEIQEQLRVSIVTEDQLGTVKYVAGVDVGINQGKQIAQGAVAVLSFPELELIESATYLCPLSFPYIPGFLSFREIPPIMGALARLQTTPDLILCDGQGIAHQRRFGLACHLGILSNLPTIGVAKSLLVGTYEPLAPHKGAWEPLIDQQEVIGAVVRTRSGVKPLYVSIGHRISLETAIEYVLRCTTKYRLPETTRRADRLSRA